MKYLFYLFSFALKLTLLSQGFDTGFDIKTKLGFLIAHRPMMNHLPEEHTRSVEATYFFQTGGTKDWHLAYKLPKVGVSVLFTTVGNKKVLGNYIGAYSFFQYPFLNKEKHKIYGKFGCGLGFTNTVFNQQTNPKNVAISSRVNALINFTLLYERQFKNSHFSAGLDITHFSNGAGKLPNLGLNLPYFLIGYGHFLNKNESLDDTKNLKKPTFNQKPWQYSFIATTSFRDYSTLDNKPKKVFSLTASTQKIFRLGLAYELGFDLIYKPTIQYYKSVIYKPKESLFQIGFYNAYLMTLDKLQIIVGMGVYVKDDYFPDDRFYHRVGMRYKIANKLILNLTLKSHWAKADYVEYGIGYTL
jgi:hypothetical protein